MLYSPSGFSRDQLLTDLMALKDQLNKGWLKGGFQNGGSVCIVAAAEIVVDQPIGFTRYSQDQINDPAVMRLGRMIYAVYVSLAGPKVKREIPLSQAMQYIAQFNDSTYATKEAVLLLIDRAIQATLGPCKTEGGAEEAEGDSAAMPEEIRELVPATA